MASPKWSIFLVNDSWQKVTGISQEMAMGSHFWDLFEAPLPAQVGLYALVAFEQSDAVLYCGGYITHCTSGMRGQPLLGLV
jgi:hypothetical protein